MKKINIAIDGPSGAGKSTIAKQIAKNLGIIYLDTGALYRSIGFYCKDNNLGTIPALKEIKIELLYQNQQQQILINGNNVMPFIRTSEVGLLASNVSKIPQVREFLLDLQRDIAKKQSVIMDGRDIGTVILKDADVKIFLTATKESRAKRRFLELSDITYEEVLSDIAKRDYQDENREIAPLKKADDAILVDTTKLDLEQSIEEISNIIMRKIGEMNEI